MSERKPTIVHFLVKGNINWMAVYGGAQPIPHLTAAGYRAAVLGVVADLAKAIRTRRLADVERCFFLSGKGLLHCTPVISCFFSKKILAHCSSSTPRQRSDPRPTQRAAPKKILKNLCGLCGSARACRAEPQTRLLHYHLLYPPGAAAAYMPHAVPINFRPCIFHGILVDRENDPVLLGFCLA